jgi:FKBP-type peptidyl-prolyl cis-trans isomerase SlyD
MQIGKDKIVSIDYTLTDQNGQTLDTSNGRGPLAYLHGSGNIIPGLERALEGKSEGEKIAVDVIPGEAYGERDERLVQAVPRAAFRGVENIQAGMQFQAQAQGQPGQRLVTVVGVEADTVRVDANHPLAGKTLHFDVTIVGVRDATPEERQHGHAHGAGGHQH